jgi:hypothetical protein
MVRISIVVLVLAALLSGCAALPTARHDDAEAPAAAIPDRIEPVAGRWQGTIAETAGWFHQGLIPVDLTITPNGTWAGTIGKAGASGTVEFKGRHLILKGTARSERDEDPVYLRLTGDATRRWGETAAEFDDREERASVSLTKTR